MADSGIIPARAGFTTRGRRRGGACADHPRSRGVYCTCPRRAWGQTGSSPLARGLPAGAQDCAWIPGIIPARAGFTRQCRRRAHRPPDHPRSRGVYGGRAQRARRRRGSSPLARGLLLRRRRRSRAHGIIPARAGFTSAPSPFSVTASDHPRSRGVYQAHPRRRGVYGWIIPARAGFTMSSTGAV